jgi:predicted metal-dependent hydrolase
VTPLPPDQAVPIRDVHLEHAFADVPKYFADGDIVMSHMFAVLSATFPDGESYFVRSVAAVRGRITDEVLANDIEGFIGQEWMHGREHRAFNAHLAELGYPTRGIERYTDRAFRLFERIDNSRVHVAVTAALEHYTATLAEMLLTDPDARTVFEHDAVRRLFLWHSLEEAEHKAVAFDTYRHVAGSERMRRLTMTAVHVDFLLELVVMTAISVSLDPVAQRHPMRTLRSAARLTWSPFASAKAARQLIQYHRRAFHLNDRDPSELVARWRNELFDTSEERKTDTSAERQPGRSR